MNSITWGASKDAEYIITFSPTNSFMIERVPGLRTEYKNEVIVLNLGVPTTSHKPHTLCTRYIIKKVPVKKCFSPETNGCNVLCNPCLRRLSQPSGTARKRPYSARYSAFLAIALASVSLATWRGTVIVAVRRLLVCVNCMLFRKIIEAGSASFSRLPILTACLAKN